MGDFLPGYVTRLCSADFDKIPKKLIVMGKENGKLYSAFDTKEELLAKVGTRKNRMTMVCDPGDTQFSATEREFLSNQRVIMMDTAQRQRIVASVGQIFSLVSLRRY
jgi:hypothetical protein